LRAQGTPLSSGAILSVLFACALYRLLLAGGIGGGVATLVEYVGKLAVLLIDALIEGWALRLTPAGS
jgi:hypothetical protein